ncbi:hypothetical protein ISF_02622 [Cordyceps fumosorosea ARSEF 2679]|uniref:DUF7907 domain-containing protein n=1 Tax=Cordyceps fumosorosea (strain ARSEF 2679) TaxID=1081104 RepID=A0A168BWU7_CORFA|nr:hypothetical protein ISF_02622 [Cordyceps fumosorosea ARSEF 2679]OAA70648.1 hypothetical protein ISF_02622 [Cordyceps fumosorosea ARSEF 2679]
MLSTATASRIARRQLPSPRHRQGLHPHGQRHRPRLEPRPLLPMHQTFLTVLHRDPSRNYIGVAHNSGHPATFFINGTDAEAARGDTRMLAEVGEPGIPFSTQFTPVNGHFVNQVGELNAGPSGERVTVTSADPASSVSLSSPGLCVQEVDGEQHPVLHIFYVGNDHERIPKECVPVNLIPQCAE